MPSTEPIPLQGASSLLWNYYKPACNSWSFTGRMLSVVTDSAQSFGALQHPLRTSSSLSIILSRCRPRSDCSVSSLALSLSCGCRMYMGWKYRVKCSVRRYCTVSVEIVWIATGSHPMVMMLPMNISHAKSLNLVRLGLKFPGQFRARASASARHLSNATPFHRAPEFLNASYINC